MRINVDIEPFVCPRPRVMCRGKFAHAYYPAGYKKWREQFVNALPVEIDSTDPIATPVTVYVELIVQRPKTTKLLTPKGDVDNYIKSVLDGLTDANVWVDDTLVETITATKRFTREGEAPGIVIEIKET